MTDRQKPHNLEYPYHELGEQDALSHADAPVVRTSFAAYRNQGDFQKAAGNLSPLFGQPDMPHLNLSAAEMKDLKESDPEQAAAIVHDREVVAKRRLVEFLDASGIDPKQVFIVKPQNQWRKGVPLNPASADELPQEQREIWDATTDEGEVVPGPERPAEQADLIYTMNPEQALAILPADCPTLVGRGQDADGNFVMWLQHGGWNGLNEGYLDDGLDFVQDDLGVDLATAHFSIAPGGIEFQYNQPTDPRSEENTTFTNPQLIENLENLRQGDDGKFYFEIDMFGYILDELAERGVDVQKQVYVNDTDTSRLDSGHSSHQRHANQNLGEDERQPFASRDMVLAMSPQLAEQARQRALAHIQERFPASQ